MKQIIPKGSSIFGNGSFMAETVKDFNVGYTPKENDFSPPIKIGTVIHDFMVLYNNEVIYIHPNWLRSSLDRV